MILLLGNPRSGTSWVGKIFDSHPDTLYLHEPDIDCRDSFLPDFELSVPSPSNLADAEKYLGSLQNLRTARARGSIPCFRKRYRSSVANTTHTFGTYMAKAIALTGVREFVMPDLVSSNRQQPIPVIKSVSLLSKVAPIHAAASKPFVVHIIRHPCGYVSSRLKGQELGLMSDGAFLESALHSPLTADYGLDNTTISTLSLPEQFAWQWVLSHEHAMRSLENSSRSFTLIYDRLCENPLGETWRMFRACDLDQAVATSNFIKRSIAGDSGSRYFSVIRDPLISRDRWRTTLSAVDRDAVLSICMNSQPGRLFDRKEMMNF